MWYLDSEGIVEGTCAEKHVTYLLDKLTDPPTEFYDYVCRQSLQMDIVCVWHSATANGGPEFSPEVLARIARLRVPLGFDIYFDEDAFTTRDKIT